MSHILEGRCSISHAVATAKLKAPLSEHPSGHAARSLRAIGYQQLSHVGRWSVDQQNLTSFIVRPLPPGKWSTAQKKNWHSLQSFLSKAQIGSFYSGQADLLLPRPLRMLQAESYVESLVLAKYFAPTLIPQCVHSWGTDGSMRPATAGLLDDKSVTSAITGEHTVVMKLPGRNISILQGELMGIIGGLILARSDKSTPIIYTDHLNSTWLIDDSRADPNIEARIRNMNGRSYYRWILHLLKAKRASVIYTKGHSDESSPPSILNMAADHYATKSQNTPTTLHRAPTPTFSMDPYTFYSSSDGWIESNIRSLTDCLFAEQCARELEFSHGLRLCRFVYDPTPPPPYPYLRSLACYSAVTQLYSRSGQLPTAARLFARNKIDSRTCRFGCTDIVEDDHHIFVECPHFDDIRMAALNDLIKFTQSRCDDFEADNTISHDVAQRLIHTAQSLFHDDPSSWPLGLSTFYLGRIPDITLIFGQLNTSHSTPIITHPSVYHVSFTQSPWSGTSSPSASPVASGAKCNATRRLDSVANLPTYPTLGIRIIP
ncbi:hypothetical protein DXG01_008368 [Tephrocybe rancida]|nr:hypothetical protein DXG01_008368 [Tephrocybe rancida]